jgi:hypothetical protein
MAGTIRHSKLLKDWRIVGDETENWEMTVQFSILEAHIGTEERHYINNYNVLPQIVRKR